MCVIRFTKIILVFLGLVGLMGCNKQSDLDLAQTSNEYAISFTAEGIGPELRVAGLPSIPVGSDGRKISKLLADDITQVPVHCIFRNSIGESFAQTILWDRIPGTQRLRLRAFKLTIPAGLDISPSSSATWYMCAVIGGDLDATGMKVNVSQTDLHTSLKPINSATPNSIVVPWVSPWMELACSEYEGKIQVSTKTTVPFHPQGVMLRVKLGNHVENKANITLDGPLVIQSNAFDDEGSFDMSPSSIVGGDMPKWVTKSGQGDAFLKYDLASAHALQYNKIDEDKTYLVWIMPRAGVTTPETTVYLGGKFDNTAIQHPTPYFLTDHQKKSTTTPLRSGQIRSLTAQATQRIKLPLEYITESNGPSDIISRATDVLALRNLIPAGQHLPTVEEASSIFPFWADRTANILVDPWAALEYMDVDEVIEWGEHPVQTYKSDFENTGELLTSLGETYAIRYKNSPFRSAWRYHWYDSGGAFSHLQITCRWVPLWEDVTLSTLQNASWWDTHPERNITRLFVEEHDTVDYYGSGSGPYGMSTYLAYWGIQKNGRPFIYGSLSLGESTGPVATKTEISDYLPNGVDGGVGGFASITLWTRPFYNKR